MSFTPNTIPARKYFICQKAIGETFGLELGEKGGLVGQHFSWITPGINSPAVLEFFEDTPGAVIDGVISVYNAHDPSKKLQPVVANDP